MRPTKRWWGAGGPSADEDRTQVCKKANKPPGRRSKTPSSSQISGRKGVRAHLVVESGEVRVPPEHHPALILSLPDQDLEHLQRRMRRRERDRAPIRHAAQTLPSDLNVATPPPPPPHTARKHTSGFKNAEVFSLVPIPVRRIFFRPRSSFEHFQV